MLRIVVTVCLVALAQAGPRPKSEENKNLNSLSEEKVHERPVTSVSYPQSDETSVKDNQFASSQILENPAYDPALYQTFIPQDAVQQYVNQFTGSPYGAYSGVYPNPAGFALQTGYEGYLVPTVPEPEPTSLATTGFNFLQTYLSRSLFGWLTRAASYLVSTLGIVLFGGAITTALCSFTPVCTITFAALPFFGLKDTAENITKTLGSEITPERVRRTAELVKQAIDKYTEMQKEFAALPESNVQKVETNVEGRKTN